ncbi:hypothetical protein PHYSODRAFT_329748 [Phytophthora sojae]|uniref:Uncharacterized protein n=1 Tax=Phytophthora sojae (strain P6497) TaxID=1094619 RepID=G4Z8D3_PHYSP|nr:hypothetical protein PHYSODRAFT_329748 [Phytophthora sojae]EGZ21853.1 hypothetical protein PHYSODRAFT_329748 [Phytophthora sojae]|eukprot:XP_009524570.1 hypothetical protein PHYSODRAFT_329748 [Phytophthora sojae]
MEIEDSKTVGDLKLRLSYFRKPELQTLFLAKKDGKWLSSGDDDVRALMKNKISKAMEEVLDDSNILDPQRPLSDFNFPCIEDDKGGRNDENFIVEPLYNRSWYMREIKRTLARAEQRRTERHARAEQRRNGWFEVRVTLGCGEVDLVIFPLESEFTEEGPVALRQLWAQLGSSILQNGVEDGIVLCVLQHLKMTLVVSLEMALAVLLDLVSLPAMTFTLLEVTPEVPNATGGGRGDYCLEEMLVALLKMMFLEVAPISRLKVIVVKIDGSAEVAREVGDDDMGSVTANDTRLSTGLAQRVSAPVPSWMSVVPNVRIVTFWNGDEVPECALYWARGPKWLCMSQWLSLDGSARFSAENFPAHIDPESYYVIVRNVPAHVEKALRVATRNERRYHKLVHARGQARLYALLSWICAVLTLGFGIYLYEIDANLVRGSTSDFDNRRLWTVGIERAAFYAFPLLGSVMLKLKIIYSPKFDSLKDKIHYSLAALV